MSKYAGEWDKDQRTGDGHQVYFDGSQYKGNFKNGIFNDYGCFWWSPANSKSGKPHFYKGFWLDGKMHGKGEFTHGDSQDVHAGYFANNLLSY